MWARNSAHHTIRVYKIMYRWESGTRTDKISLKYLIVCYSGTNFWTRCDGGLKYPSKYAYYTTMLLIVAARVAEVISVQYNIILCIMYTYRVFESV